MKQLLICLMLLFSIVSQADLIDQVRLEDTFRGRIEDLFKLYDENAKVLIRFEFKKFQGFLPGTNIESQGSFGPTKFEATDVVNVNIEIYTALVDVPQEVRDVILRMIPIDKSKVTIEYRKLNAQLIKAVPKLLDSTAIGTITQDAVGALTDSISKTFGFLTGIGILMSLGFAFFANQKKIKEFKEQIAVLASALSDGASSRQTPMAQNFEQKQSSISSKSDGKSQIEKFSNGAIQELFADCYWCYEEGYASWLWKQITNEQRKDLMLHLPFMKNYSQFFMGSAQQEYAYHEHPYYLEPSNLSEMSQEDLCLAVKENLSSWHQLSPLRQQNLPLSFEEKLLALQTKPVMTKLVARKKSEYRVLEAKPQWGDVSDSDEKAIFHNPEMVPIALRTHVKSLVWLARKDSETIRMILSKYDARSLASAWLGADEVLKILEAQIPEKKLKLLQTYKTKMPADRHSPAYLSLVEEGLKHEVA